ncbi:hypothetical protein RJ639_011890 [Escallonia herrerae]|uniref:Uncharacterized protein n=1 Tax=Escallonia herrerae TaxID=1293975 RepID=A0AA88VLE3_9ASTE|nr:hypothetical protein RJ639_011890 [Escallonia herrerae]
MLNNLMLRGYTANLCNVPRPLEVVVLLYLLPSVEVTVEEATGRVAFFHHNSTNSTKWMEGARKFTISKVGEDVHPELWRNHPPEWIRNDIWQKMVDVWASTKWQEKSRCAKTNRSVNDEPSHTGGSVSHAVIGVELKEKMPDISDAKLNLEVYELTHKLKHDSNGQPLEEQDRPYVSKKAKAICLEVQKMKEIEIAMLVEIEVEKRMKEKDMQQAEVSAADAIEDGNDETFDELGG